MGQGPNRLQVLLAFKIYAGDVMLPEGLYLATSEEVRGLLAQGRTITETLEIARDVAKNC
jgi:predicted RNase H-like HicB family nuclease